MSYSSKDLILPHASVVIVNYNGYRWFELFMDSLIKTEYPNFEIIVVDNSSSDQSVQYLRKKSGKIRVIELDENKGYAQAANIGANVATGAILVFVNNDMEFKSDWLNNAVRKLLSDKEIAAVQCKILTYSKREKIDCIGLSVDRYNLPFIIGRHEIDRGQYDDLMDIGACSGGAMVIWRHIFQELGAFDPTYFLYYEDVDLSWRIKMRGYRISPAPSSIIYHVGSATIKGMHSSTERIVSPFLAFHLTKNYIYCWSKNSSLKGILLYWPVILLIVFSRISFELINGRISVALSQTKGVFWNMKHFRLVVKKRAELNKLKVIDSDTLLAKGGGSSHLLRWLRFARRVVKRSESGI